MARFLLLPLLLLLVPPAQAQDDVPLLPRLSAEVIGGASSYGRFLEQRLTDGRERELRAPLAASFGVHLLYQPFRETAARLTVTFTPAELEFRDDTGTDSGALDDSGLADLGMALVSLEVVQYLLEGQGALVPYAVVGVAGGFWMLDADANAVLQAGGGDDTLVRFGGSTGAGVEIRPADRLLVRVEVNALALGNPFSGKNAFRVIPNSVTDELGATTFEEPDTVRLVRLAVGVGYMF